MTFGGMLERAATPFDAARRTAFGVARGRPRLRRLLVRRDLRLASIATGHALVAFALSVLYPAALIVLGPVLLGVAHVAADVRYLVLRRILPRWWQTTVWAFCAALIAVRAMAEFHVLRGHLDRVELGLAALWAGIGLAAGYRESRGVLRLAFGLVVLVLLSVLALRDPLRARLVFAQAHNVVAILLFATLFRRRLAPLVVPAIAVTAGALLLASGRMYAVTMQHDTSIFGLHALAAADFIAPGLRADHALGLTAAYAFLQSIHYAVWLVFIPQDAARGPGLVSFRTSVRSLIRDFGPSGLAAIGLAAAAVLGFACVNALRTRTIYLSLALFHGYLELALFAYFWAAGLHASRSNR